MPNERALTEKMLGLLSEAGLPDTEVTLAVIEYVVGSAAIDTAGAAQSPLYPSLDEQFEFGIEALIAGLRQRVRTGQPPLSGAPGRVAWPPGGDGFGPGPLSRPGRRRGGVFGSVAASPHVAAPVTAPVGECRPSRPGHWTESAPRPWAGTSWSASVIGWCWLASRHSR